MTKRRKSTEEPAAAATVAALPDSTDRELAELRIDLEGEKKDEPTERFQHRSIADLFAYEQRAVDGKWFPWLDVKDGEVLIGDFVESLGEEIRLKKQWELDAIEKAEKDGKKIDVKTAMPSEVRRRIEAVARFNKGVVKGWRGAAFDGYAFTFENVLKLWQRSIDFRMFVEASKLDVRIQLSQEIAATGKA